MARFEIPTFSGMMQVRANKRINRSNELVLAQNVNGDIVGSVASRKGFTQVGDTLETNNDVTGLHQLKQLNGTTQTLATVNNAGDTAMTLKYNNAGVWTNITGATSLPADALADMFNFVDRTYVVGKNAANSYLTTAEIDNITYAATTFPKAAFGRVYGNRIHLFDVEVSGVRYASHDYYSSLPTYNATTGRFEVTFANLTEDFLDPRTNDGEAITGHAESYGRLLIFKLNSLHAYDKINLRQVSNIGTNSRRSVIEIDGNNVAYFHYTTNRKGFYFWDGTGSKLMSRAIMPFIQGMSENFIDQVVGGQLDDHLYWYIDDVTLDAGIAEYYNIPQTYQNVMVDYNFAANQWAIHTLPIVVTRMAAVDNKLYLGASTGEVYDWLVGDDDDGTPIEWKIRTHNVYGDDPNARQHWENITINMHQPTTAEMRLAFDGGQFESPESGGQLNNADTYFSIGKKAKRFQVEIAGIGSTGRFIAEGMSGEYVSEGKVER